ncbi:replication-associated recombination protein A [Candidatus Microgenomates bacterium]|nr:MAG: replication-associated recombination protein A [Candidatus Microgenomates bacterium]
MSLAFNLRPQNLKEFVGQKHLVGEGRIIGKMIESDTLFSMILWGPPGSGKTTLANIISKETNSDFHALSAVSMGKEALFKIIEIAKKAQEKNKKTILFIDEIHRWNKAQQDALLPYVESGLVTLIGATTENPSFEIISPLLSRCRVFVLKSLEQDELETLIDKALKDKDRGVGKYKKSITKDAKELLVRLSGGDARIMLNALEIAVTNFKQKEITGEIVKEIFQTRSAGLYDKKADEHYNIISAFIKSVRGSDVDASLYYLARMLENGEDPKFIARRMIILASEDIGMADRGALIQANEAFEAVNKIGMPEAQLILAHITIYLAKAAKSRAVANALGKAKQAVYEFPNEPIPLHLRNAPTKLMKNLGYAKNYTWSEKYVGPRTKLSFLPEKLKNKKFYEP